MTTKEVRPRGRPRRFDPEAAVETAQALFHARGYDAVGVADVTAALGINPPSFYAAFGSKAALYARVLARWGEHGAIPFADILRPDRPVAEGLAALLEAAARRYAAGADARGCLVLEGTRASDADARDAALACNRAAEALIRNYIAARHPLQAAAVADYVSTVMSGLSAKARNGHAVDQLIATARLASRPLADLLG
ncbi:transcriptional regulator, TetR family [Sphingomonas guangdongensis]|uniref:Transcriptional regulator, TetR family n=1 Tax=Sphingomonas guangdongensis TaxID=1141890 RepID=A0A285QYD9_9SPHN|nr:helix-turn-helix domain-containing protein [Sphingomonas guangdongensis]SOB86399.1 transcriptional regulator, TetR family [Sphingomonas guangdongensis]